MKRMTIFSDGGLGNRLNSLIGGLISSDMIKSEPVICWPVNNWCGCEFYNLYQTNIPVINGNIHSIFQEDDKFYLIHDNQTGKKIKNILNHSEASILKLTTTDQDIVYFHNKIPNYFTEKQIVSNLKKLKIQSSILQTVLNFCKETNINKKIKGVHLRKTDHGRQIDSDVIFRQIQTDTDFNYFVCSDDKDTEDYFNQLSNVITFPKTSYVEKLVEGNWTTKIRDTEGRVFPYNVNRSAQSVIEGFSDLLILSRTNIVINNKSSFLGWAKIYSKVDDLNEFA